MLSEHLNFNLEKIEQICIIEKQQLGQAFTQCLSIMNRLPLVYPPGLFSKCFANQGINQRQRRGLGEAIELH